MTKDSRMTSAWLDSPDRYGRVSRLLHWAMAGLILWQLTGMILRAALGRVPVVSFFVGLHPAVGTALFALVVARILWALAMRGRRPAHGRGPVGIAARLGHLALYALMLAVPAAALIRAWGGPRGLQVWGLTVFPARAETDVVAWAVALGNGVHGMMGWLLALLLLGHVAMVAVHEGLWRDGTLRRMAGRG